MSEQLTKVLFIGGYGRSGSTILDLLLDRVPGITAVGEFRHLFGRALGDNELCSCGQPIQKCSYWNKIITEAFPDGYNREQIQQAVKACNAIIRTPQLIWPALSTPSLRKQAKIYHDAFSAVYKAVAKVSGASVIVDSSKYPMHGLFMQSTPGIDMNTMLLVRDPRAVAYSWQRYRIRPEVHWETREMPRHGVIRSALAWDMSNDLTKLIDKEKHKFRLQRYEDFINEPLRTIQDIASFALGKDTRVSSAIFEQQPHTPHTIAGNPIRIGSSRITVKADSEWEKQLGTLKKTLVTICCARQMHRFGYGQPTAEPVLSTQ